MVNALSAGNSMKILTTFFDAQKILRRGGVRNGPKGQCPSMIYLNALLYSGPLRKEYTNGPQIIQSAGKEKFHSITTL
jgi:hypothetical protein